VFLKKTNSQVTSPSNYSIPFWWIAWYDDRLVIQGKNKFQKSWNIFFFCLKFYFIWRAWKLVFKLIRRCLNTIRIFYSLSKTGRKIIEPTDLDSYEKKHPIIFYWPRLLAIIKNSVVKLRWNKKFLFLIMFSKPIDDLFSHKQINNGSKNWWILKSSPKRHIVFKNDRSLNDEAYPCLCSVYRSSSFCASSF
jgi:hypothetical protein